MGKIDTEKGFNTKHGRQRLVHTRWRIHGCTLKQLLKAAKETLPGKWRDDTIVFEDRLPFKEDRELRVTLVNDWFLIELGVDKQGYWSTLADEDRTDDSEYCFTLRQAQKELKEKYRVMHKWVNEHAPID